MGRSNQRLRPIKWWETVLSDDFRPTLLVPLWILLGATLIVTFFKVEWRHFVAYAPQIASDQEDADGAAFLYLTVFPCVRWLFISTVTWPALRSLTNAALDWLRNKLTSESDAPASC